MGSILRPMLPMVLILLLPIIPFVLFGDRMEAAVEAWKENPPAAPWVAAAVIALLSTDILLPIPSSVISTLAGVELGIVGGALASWLGMSLGAAGGFALARYCGPRLAGWLSRPSDLERARDLADRLGPAVLAIARGVPVLAEATVLWMGLHGLSWRKFLPPVLLANLGLSLAYSALGRWTEEYAGLAPALSIAVAFPVLLALAFQRWMKSSGGDTATGVDARHGGRP